MVTNRSVPANIILPHIIYRNVAEASRWLTVVFDFEEHYRYGDPSGTRHPAPRRPSAGFSCQSDAP
jgi:hypothetical protein